MAKEVESLCLFVSLVEALLCFWFVDFVRKQSPNFTLIYSVCFRFKLVYACVYVSSFIYRVTYEQFRFQQGVVSLFPFWIYFIIFIILEIDSPQSVPSD